MKKEYVLAMFLICFFIWASLVDNAVLPTSGQLQVEPGVFSHYRIKKGKQIGDFVLRKDQVVLYAGVNDRERFFYIERMPGVDAALRNMAPDTPLTLGYVKRFPKVWKKQVYLLKANDRTVMQFSAGMLKRRQVFIWKFTGAVVGVFVLLCGLAFVNKPLRRR
ncbi:hypothetical protein [Pontiella sp.]|uniref:hypothetical protein n=1 Tax=Pontiella sp. TaxID=2837462 RepID=UPI00356ACB35